MSLKPDWKRSIAGQPFRPALCNLHAITRCKFESVAPSMLLSARIRNERLTPAPRLHATSLISTGKSDKWLKKSDRATMMEFSLEKMMNASRSRRASVNCGSSPNSHQAAVEAGQFFSGRSAGTYCNEEAATSAFGIQWVPSTPEAFRSWACSITPQLIYE